ncbi:LamG-like jellyroll fold domain-containing protein [Dapis sp. BLCC M126]|uniref:LamG-like jellyroll fold domain-containing protein n=1 Tax=Dapis sp. BLCC M126 TaxID=3400189 RepID=UPI003CEACFE6
MSEVATKNITFWNTTGYNYPGFGKTVEVPDGLGGTIGITYNQIDYDNRGWRGKPDGGNPVTENRFLSGEIENNFSLTGKVKGITATMPLIRTLGKENNYSVTLDFSKYKASAAGDKATDGATSGDTYLAISRFFNGSKAGYTTIKVTAKTLDGSELNLGDWKLFNSGTLGKGHNARVFLDAATQTISGKNSQGKQEFCPTPPNPGTSFGTDTGLGLFELPTNQRYVSITLSFKQKKIQGVTPNDLHDIYVASNTSSTSPIDATPQTKPIDINNGLQLHLPLNEIVENAAKEKEVVDVSPGKLNGKVNGATVIADDRFGNCLSFNGVDNYIQMPEMNFDYSKGITVEAWVYYHSFKNQSRVIDFANGPSKNNIIFGNHTTTNDGLLVVFVGSTRKAIEVKGILEVSKWLHLTATIDESGNAKVYKDGQEVGGGLVAIPNNVNRTKNYVGLSNWSGTGYFHGKMSNLRVYNRVLSPEEINECMKVDGTPPPMDINRGLQLHLPLNEIVENAAKEKEVVDVSAGKLNGKVNGAIVVADSRFGKCINFDGNDDYIIINPMPNFPSKTITVLCWIKSNNTVKAGTIFAYANSQTDNAFLLYEIRKLIPHVLNVTADTGIAFNDGQWHCVAASWNSSDGQLKIYKDGEEKYSGTVSKGKNISSGGALVLGQEQDRVAGGFDANQAFEGQMAHVRMYNRVLSPEEINECMKVDGTPPSVDINRGLELHLPLNEIVENAAKEKEVVDVSASKLKGKVHGEAEIVADDRFGKCINFDGVDDYIELPTTAIPQTGEITISFWANGDTSLPKATTILWAVNQYNHYMVNIHLPWGNVIHFDCGNTTTSDNSGDRISKIAEAVDFKDKWTYWTFTKNVTTGEMSIYLNGSLWHNGTGKNKPITSITQLKFGASDAFYDGKVTHLRIYDRVLSPEEINECMKVDGTPPSVDINRGLQLHLPLNEIVENAAKEKEVVDVSPAKLKGKVNGNPKILDDPGFGNCLNFDGVDDYIQMPEMNIDYSQGLTVEAWVHYNSFKNWSRIIDFGNGIPNDNIVFANEATTSNLCFDSFKGTTSNRVKANGKLELSKWLHLAVTVDGSGNTKIYNNGTEVGSGSINLPNKINRTKNYIGKSNWPDELFYGKMSHLRMYNRALSKEEINECMEVDQNPPPIDINRGLQLHLPLNEIVENAAKEKEVVDVSAAKVNGKVNGKPIIVADSHLGNCLSFDGVDDYIQMPEMNVDYSQGFTVGAWVYYENFKSWSRIIDFGNAQSNDNILFANEGTTKNVVLDVYQGATQNRIKADGMLELNQWLYVTVTVDGSGSGKIYKNGEEVQSGLVHLPNNINRTKNYIGDSNWPNDAFFHGKMSHLRMYNRALSKEEINECMEVDGTPPPMDINRGLQLHLPLNEIVENAAKEKEVVDISVAKINGKVNGKPIVVADDRFGNCLNFDGNNDYIIINPMPNFPSETLTVLCWVKSNNTTKAGTPVSYANSETSNAFILFDIRKLIPEITAVTKQTEVVLNDGKWHCVALSWNSSDGQLKVYKDGEEKDSGTLSKGKKINSGGALILGQEQDKLAGGFDVNQAFEGQMAHVRIYDRVLSPEEINECMKVDETPPPMDINRGLQLHLPLNEIVKNAAKEKEVLDISTAKLNGKVSGATVVADSKFGNCLSFDGVDDNIQMPEMNIDYSKGFTVEAWCYSSKFKNYSRIIDFANGPTEDNIIFSHYVNNSILLVVYLGSQRKELVINQIFENNQWLHLAATVDQLGNAKIYKNGQQVGEGLLAIPNTVNRTKNYLGNTQNAKSPIYFQGKMSNLRLYNRPLSPEEIKECIKVDQTPPPMDINRGLQLHLPLNEIVENAAKEKEVVDASGQKLNGKVNGNPEIVADSRFGNCINFDGVDDYIELPTAAIPQSDEITISFWAHGGKSLPKTNSIIVAYDQSNHRVVNIHLPWSDSKIYFDCGNTTTSDDSYDRIDKLSQAVDFKDKWTHWVFTKNVATGEMKIYQNGSLWQSGTGKNKSIGSVAMVRLGCDSGTLFYHGKVANLRIYDRVLSPEEINELIQVDEVETTDTTSTTSEGDTTQTTETTDTTSTTGEGETTQTTGGTDTTSTTSEGDTTQTTETTDTSSKTGEGETTQTTNATDTTSTTGGTDTTSTTSEGETDTLSTTDTTETTQKPMEYQIYQVNGNPTIKTGYPASEWTAVIAGFNCGAKQKYKATALTIMPVVDDGEWKIKCDIKDADDRYWDVAVLFIRNNMVNRLNNFYR